MPTILSKVREHEADVHPTRAGLWVLLPYQLVKRQILLDVLKPLAALLDVTINAKVCGLSLQVLTIVHTAHGFVQLFAAEAGAYLDGLTHRYPQWFQDVGTELHEVDHLLHVGFIVNSETLRCLAGIEFFNREVHSYGCVHKS